MLRGQPSYRRSSPSVLDAYPLRILLGWVVSLGIVVLFLHLPFSSSPEQVGWTVRQSTDPIQLTELSSEERSEDQDEESLTDEAGAPPPTQFAPPDPASSTGTSTGDETGAETTSSSSPADSSSRVRSITALTVEDRPPRILGGKGALNLHINYPAAARRKGIEGRLELTFTVDTEGRVDHIEVSESLHPLCDSAAVRALRSVRFHPGTYNGEPVPVRMSLPIRFQLKAKSGPPAPKTASAGGG